MFSASGHLVIEQHLYKVRKEAKENARLFLQAPDRDFHISQSNQRYHKNLQLDCILIILYS